MDVVVIAKSELSQLLREAVACGVADALKALHKPDPKEMTEEEAARYLSLQPATLRSWRSLGKGPAFHKYNRNIRYSRADLDKWLAMSRVQTADSLEVQHETGR